MKPLVTKEDLEAPQYIIRIAGRYSKYEHIGTVAFSVAHSGAEEYKGGKAIVLDQEHTLNSYNAKLKGVLIALEWVSKFSLRVELKVPALLYKALNNWMYTWQAAGWKKAGGDAPACLDLYKKIYAILDQMPKELAPRFTTEDGSCKYAGLEAEVLLTEEIMMKWPDDNLRKEIKSLEKDYAQT